VRAVRYAVIVLVLAMLASCSLALNVRLTNTANQAIIIALGDKAYSIGPGETSVFAPGAKRAFTVSRAGKVHWYQISDEPFDLQTLEGILWFKARILSTSYATDGCIYVVPPKHDAATPLTDVQPPGFPLCADSEVKP
jgi:hypothetical protein